LLRRSFQFAPLFVNCVQGGENSISEHWEKPVEDEATLIFSQPRRSRLG